MGIFLLLIGLVPVAPHCTGIDPAAPPVTAPPDSTSLAGWTMVWHDEFNGTALDLSKWNYEVNGNGGGNNELQYYTDAPANAFLEQGWLVIQALKEQYQGKAYTSARLNTDHKGDWLYGRVDVRARLPFGRGLWPAIWLLPTDWAYGGWPTSGEIDIMELVGHEPGKVYGTKHWGTDPAHRLLINGSMTLPGGARFADAFHLFSLVWTADSLHWFVDGSRFFSTGGGQPFDKRFHLLLNVAVGGDWPGSPDGTTTFPQVMIVDYVRVYAKGN